MITGASTADAAILLLTSLPERTVLIEIPAEGWEADYEGNQPWLLIGTTSQANTVQDHAKLKLAWQVAPGLKASYTLGKTSVRC